MQTNRLLIIGIDGACFKFITPLLRTGKLPNIQKIIENGVCGDLESTIPPISAAAWASMLTGQNPGKHGVFDFFEFKKNAYKKKVIDIDSIKTTTLWQVLDAYDKKSIFINIPIMYPAKRINGVMVTGALTPPGKKCAFPESLSRELYRKNYIVDIAYDYIPNLETFRQYVSQMSNKRFQTFRCLLEKYPWDIAMANFVGIERLKQSLWDHPDLIEELYIEYDQYIGKLMNNLDKDVSVILLSVNGYTTVKKKFFVNEWLADLDLLAKEIKVGEPSIPEFINLQFGKWREVPQPVRELLLRSGFNSDRVRAFIPDSLEMLLKKFTPLKVKQALPREHLIINWKHTQAYLSSRYSFAININLKGREPSGIVEPGQEYEEIRNYIIRELYRLKDPTTLEDVIDQVYKGEELFWGENAAIAPDIIFIPQNYAYSLEPDKRTEKCVISDTRDHAPVLSAPHPRGIFIGCGPEFANGQSIKNLRVWDVMPNILHLLNIPISVEMDGVVKRELFKATSEYALKDTEIEFREADYFTEPNPWIQEPETVHKAWEVYI